MIHRFQSAKGDPGDGTVIKPSNWNDVHAMSPRVISANTTGVSTDDMILGQAGSGGITYTLPLVPFDGEEIRVYKTDLASGMVTVASSAGIGSLGTTGATAYFLAQQMQRAAFTWTAALSGWLVGNEN